jgi:phosphoribosylanthranilate isomerase
MIHARPLLKICCIQSAAEAATAIAAGADAIGLVSEMPSGPGVIPEAVISAIVRSTPPHVTTFLLTSSADVSHIVAQVRRTGVKAVQLVDRIMLGSPRELRAALEGVSIVQVIHVTGPRALAEALAAAPFADALLLDSGDPSAPVRELGGTGRVHDWQISRRIREAVQLPVWLAGGLTAANVAEAVQTVRPRGVDVCTGVRSDGALDVDKLRALVKQLGLIGG